MLGYLLDRTDDPDKLLGELYAPMGGWDAAHRSLMDTIQSAPDDDTG